MFAARCLGISLAFFVLLYVPLSLAVSRGWRFVVAFLKPSSARRTADLLFALRLLPFAGGLAFTLIFTVPSFLLLEPRATNESVGTLPVILGIVCVMLLIIGLRKTISAQIRTSRAIMKWLEGSTVMEPCAVVPVFRTGNDAPSLTVAGVREPKVLVSEAAVAALNPAEMRAALKHELAHVRYYDNLKKLLFRFTVFPGMSELEAAWGEQSEFAADDAAVNSIGDALDLASALIKVSRLKPAQPVPAVANGLLHSSTALSHRIQRLFCWKDSSASAPDPRIWYALPPAIVTCAVVAATYGSTIAQIHALTEWLVR